MSDKSLEISTDPAIKAALKAQESNRKRCDKRWSEIIDELHEIVEIIKNSEKSIEIEQPNQKEA